MAFCKSPGSSWWQRPAHWDDAAIAAEYDRLFGGVGKPEVFVYASHYLAGFLNEKPLARLRTSLDRLGLARGDTMPETEDHVAYLCEVMRYLIAGDDMAVCNPTAQRDFLPSTSSPGCQPCATRWNSTRPRASMQPWRASRRPLPLWRRRVLTCSIEECFRCAAS